MGRKTLTGPVTEHIAGEFRAERARLDLSYSEVAEKAGVAESTVQRASRATGGLNIEAFCAICEALDLDPVEVLSKAVVSRSGSATGAISQSGDGELNITVEGDMVT
ncbi:MAG: helix-turn-helix transcriptional regulator, partial [Propionibacteriaceae bacterium]|nr:helix-turn-helix transcriptional regulator [Propionibacteriaceae bacterium]